MAPAPPTPAVDAAPVDVPPVDDPPVDDPAVDTPARSRRAPAMPAQERRAAIIAATLPLLFVHGSAITTRQIAEAAGIAEGTIFRVFPDKEALIDAAIDKAFDPAPIVAALEAIDPNLPFEARLVAAIEILRDRTNTVWRLMTSVGFTKRMPANRHNTTDLAPLAALFEPERERLRRDPEVAARHLRGLVISCTHPALAGDDPISAPEIVSLLLDGIRAPGPEAKPKAKGRRP